ncbi:amino acid ABC transporter substrate-binding protein [Schleiferilactobacillus perolens]|jgi:polar amino acid transport system substrate-binding protein|uniref:amino acid ABC transporter substrate-binding protein n=1 Tax=Schleiferilactobacillus perolens TaxID=100468 RepID=UPI003B5B5037
MKLSNKRRGMTLLVFAVFLILLISGCARRIPAGDSTSQIEQRKTIVVGLDETFVPMGFRAKNGQLSGFDIDLAKAVGKKIGLKMVFQPIDWDMKETELRNHTIDLIWNGYTETAERKQHVAFSLPYLTNQQIIAVTRASGVRTIADLKDKIIGAQTGSSAAQDIDRFPKLLKNRVKNHAPILYDSYNDAFIDLGANRIQGLVLDSVFGEYTIAHSADPKAYAIIKSGFPSEEFAVGMRKSDNQLRTKINRALRACAADGTITRLAKKWFGDAAVIAPTLEGLTTNSKSRQ